MMILLQIKLFLFVLSIIYILRFIVELAIRLFQDNPDALTLSKTEQFLHYVALSYIITYILI
jgi:Na+-driven multidrug efflux pump